MSRSIISLTRPLVPELLAPFASGLSLYEGPGEGAFYCLGLAELRRAADMWGCSLAETMARCLELGVWPLRFRQNRGWLSSAEQAVLLRGRAVVVGCGGLGGYAACLLARAGLGSLTLCDGDVFEESNLNRQLFCTEDSLGLNKAEHSGRELARLASHISLRVVGEYATQASLPDLLRHADLAVDCLDSLPTRRWLEEACATAGIAYIHASIAGLEAFTGLGGKAFALMDSLYGPAADKADSPCNEGGAGSAGPTSGAETRAGSPTPTPAAAAVLQTLLAIQTLLGSTAAAPGELAHLDLSIPELERFRCMP